MLIKKINHEQFGYEFLNKHGYIDASYIKWHGETPKKYKEHNACSDSEIPQELILLWEADMHIDQTGKNVGYEYRLEDIGKRLGFGVASLIIHVKKPLDGFVKMVFKNVYNIKYRFICFFMSRTTFYIYFFVKSHMI